MTSRKIRYLLFVFFIALSPVGSARLASGAPEEKPRVAVVEPLKGDGIKDSEYERLNKSKLTAEIESAIHSTRKFEVLSRQDDILGAVREEQKFANSDLTQNNAARGGLLESANFLIIPKVQKLDFYSSFTPVPNINKFRRVDAGSLVIDTQILDTETGAIKATFNMKSSFATKEQVVNSKGGSPNSSHFMKMAQDIGAQIASQLIDVVFPMKVIKRSGNTIWINRGQDGGLKNGEVLNLYHAGELLIDPDTGENLGSAEMYLGQVKVLRVNPKITTAEIVTPDIAEQVQQLDILRKP